MAIQMEWVSRSSAESTEVFVARFREPVYRLALAITGRPDLAEDIAQEVLLRALRNRHNLKTPLGWLRVVTTRCAMTALKKNKREVLDSEPAVDADFDSLAVRQTLAKLGTEQQTILALTFSEGWTYAEIAEALGIPEGTVGSRLHAAKEEFRRKWGANL